MEGAEAVEAAGPPEAAVRAAATAASPEAVRAQLECGHPAPEVRRMYAERPRAQFGGTPKPRERLRSPRRGGQATWPSPCSTLLNPPAPSKLSQGQVTSRKGSC